VFDLPRLTTPDDPLGAGRTWEARSRHHRRRHLPAEPVGACVHGTGPAGHRARHEPRAGPGTEDDRDRHLGAQGALNACSPRSTPGARA